MRTQSRQVKKVLKEKFPEYKFSVTTTNMARGRKNLNVMVILPIKLDTRTQLSIKSTVSSFMSNSNDILGWRFATSVGVTSNNN